MGVDMVVRFKTLSHKNAIKLENWGPPRLYGNPKYPLKRIHPKLQGPPPHHDFQLLCIYDII